MSKFLFDPNKTALDPLISVGGDAGEKSSAVTVSDRRFHWQTQNSAGPSCKAGRRYLESRDNGWAFQLFVRPTQADGYRVCGPLRLTSSDDIGGDRPMNITWTLDVPLWPKLFAEFSVLRGQG